MKILLDTCVWGGGKSQLVTAGHDVVWAGDWEADPGDDAILDLAYRDGRILITLDKDFGELVFLRRLQHRGIIRLVGFLARQQAQVCLDLLKRFEAELNASAIVTAEPGRVRIRRSPLS